MTHTCEYQIFKRDQQFGYFEPCTNTVVIQVTSSRYERLAPDEAFRIYHVCVEHEQRLLDLEREAR